jgi:hypothetical protein
MHMTARLAGRPSWQAIIDMPSALVAALYLRDAGGLQVRAEVTPPPLEPFVDYDGALVPYATEAASAAWGPWWDGLHGRQAEFRGVPPLVPDPFPELPVDLRALIEIGLPAAEAWFGARKREDVQVMERHGRPPNLLAPVREIVGQVEDELGRPAAHFDLLISILPVKGVWGRRARRDHVLVSRALMGYADGFAALLEPVIRQLAA